MAVKQKYCNRLFMNFKLEAFIIFDDETFIFGIPYKSLP